ncbi:MAG: flagellar biosynthetic protein FliP [Gemmatales bacterium]|nr:MAG: flagellar biosynthetic protein FliP [Gemmatales bacterium]
MDLIPLSERLAKSGAFDNLSPAVQTALFLGALALVPMLLVTVTAFTRIVIVLSFIRRAVGTQEIPPNPVIIGLALFLTFFVMGPTLEAIDREAVRPYLDNKIDGNKAFELGIGHLREFMLRQTRRQDLALFLHLGDIKSVETPSQTPLRALVPAFVVSELKTAFVMGVCLLLPFLLIDLVVASVLTSMGMVMMPPVIISAPVKVLLFVVADGWHLVAYALSQSFG